MVDIHYRESVRWDSSLDYMVLWRTFEPNSKLNVVAHARAVCMWRPYVVPKAFLWVPPPLFPSFHECSEVKIKGRVFKSGKDGRWEEKVKFNGGWGLRKMYFWSEYAHFLFVPLSCLFQCFPQDSCVVSTKGYVLLLLHFPRKHSNLWPRTYTIPFSSFWIRRKGGKSWLNWLLFEQL